MEHTYSKILQTTKYWLWAHIFEPKQTPLDFHEVESNSDYIKLLVQLPDRSTWSAVRPMQTVHLSVTYTHRHHLKISLRCYGHGLLNVCCMQSFEVTVELVELYRTSGRCVCSAQSLKLPWCQMVKNNKINGSHSWNTSRMNLCKSFVKPFWRKLSNSWKCSYFQNVSWYTEFWCTAIIIFCKLICPCPLKILKMFTAELITKRSARYCHYLPSRK